MKTAFQEGQEAARQGKDLRDNPYDPETQEWGYEDWIQGFESAKGSK